MLPRSVVARSARALLVSLPLLLVSGGCATNPATGKPQLTFFGEEAELSMGKEADAEIVGTVGVYDDYDLGDYVEEVGQRLAASSERPYLPWSFKVLDDPTVNAFALPGGYVYVTRGILAELGSEAELAAVLGHEIGHVTAKHSLHRQSQQMLAAGAVITAAVILDPEYADEWADLGMLGLGIAFLKYSRDDERQADDLGLRYLMRAGYDPSAMPGVFEMLEQVSQAEGGGSLPRWLATHPDPGKRRVRISEEVTAVQARGEMRTDMRVEREAFLHHLDGLAYGPDPRLGALRDGAAVHPTLGFRVHAPAGWSLAGTSKGLTLRHPGGGSALVIENAGDATAAEAEAKFFAEQGVSRGREWEDGGVRWGAFTAKRKDGDLAGTVGFTDHEGQTFELLAVAPAASWESQRSELEAALASFEGLHAPDEIDANRLQVVPLTESLPLVQFAEKWPSTVGLADLALLNRVHADGTLAANSLVKRVVAGDAARRRP
ncbi:MAG TPA: M48 family metallopeptidase [Thermoanaerobaculia bacterium]|nr:M48 family metallopeptidase [Thermoanaerobaculia bacterium]HXT51631.1 M48 family metallopeptidase [Thermoanaerobaculia bacterium]